MNEDLEFKDIDEDDEEKVKIPEIHGTKNYMTRACYNRLLDERKNLVLVERPNVVNVVAWAASNGDRSENAELPVPANGVSARNRPPASAS